MVIAISNNKGGVAKTSTSVNLAYGLALMGKKTLLVDTDPQANATLSVTNKLPDRKEGTIYDVFFSELTPLENLVRKTNHENLDLVYGTLALTNSDLRLAPAPNRERFLARSMKTIKDKYEYIIFDTPPNIGLLLTNVWLVSDFVIIPVECGLFALAGMNTLIESLEEARRVFDLNLPVLGVLATKYSSTKISNSALEELKNRFDRLMFNTVIPKNVKVEEAHVSDTFLFNYAPHSPGAIAYKEFSAEVIQKIKKYEER